MKNREFTFWYRFSLINLAVVALIGIVMRYKIGFELPFFHQKFLLHAHSHFAFAGWISHALITLMIAFISKHIPNIGTVKYRTIIIANMICAYGMLIFFSIQGYGGISIFFSTASIFVSWAFAWIFLKDIKKHRVNHPSTKWFTASLVFNIISSFGAFTLAYMMASKGFQNNSYLMAIYYFLHFQYNGWFFFACMGLAISLLFKFNPSLKTPGSIFWLFALSCVPTYFLSVLWLEMPVWLYILVIISAFAQFIAWIKFVNIIRKKITLIKIHLSTFSQILFLYVAVALSIKLLLQLGSTIPFISDLAFGFRPIIIAYLHLVLLAIISVFILAYLYSNGHIKPIKISIISLFIFISAVFLNELMLTIQGIASFSYTLIPYINEILLGISVILFSSAFLLFISQFAGHKITDLSGSNKQRSHH